MRSIAAHERNNDGWRIVFIAMAILFNPFIKIVFSADTWHVIDLLSAGILALSLLELAPDCTQPPNTTDNKAINNESFNDQLSAKNNSVPLNSAICSAKLQNSISNPEYNIRREISFDEMRSHYISPLEAGSWNRYLATKQSGDMYFYIPRNLPDAKACEQYIAVRAGIIVYRRYDSLLRS
jgi:hypothetical protein